MSIFSKIKKSSTDTKVKLCLLVIITALAITCAVSLLKSKTSNMPDGNIAQTVGVTGSSGSHGGATQGTDANSSANADKQSTTNELSKKQEANRITVSAKTMKKETIQSTIKLTGNVSSKTEVNLYPDTAGKVTSIKATLGSYVNKGEIVAYVDPSKPGSSYAASPVIATVSGTIIDIPVNTGDTISTGTVVATTGSLKDLSIKVYVAEKYSTYLKTGLPAYITLTVAPDEPFIGNVVKISPIVNKTTRTIETELEFNKLDSKIKPGMFASVNLVVQESKNTFVVPKDAIKNYNGKESVLIVGENNTASRVFVTTGIGNDTDIEVKSGITEGMQVITAGSVTDGSLLRVANQEETL